jgi:hypothetical protein
MKPTDVKERLATLANSLRTFEESLAAQDVPLDVVSDFKSSVDDLRLRLWGMLTARSVDDQLAFQQRFRLRRAREICLQVASELREGGLPVDPDELRMLAVASRSVTTAATEALAGEPPPPG